MAVLDHPEEGLLPPVEILDRHVEAVLAGIDEEGIGEVDETGKVVFDGTLAPRVAESECLVVDDRSLEGERQPDPDRGFEPPVRFAVGHLFRGDRDLEELERLLSRDRQGGDVDEELEFPLARQRLIGAGRQRHAQRRQHDQGREYADKPHRRSGPPATLSAP